MCSNGAIERVPHASYVNRGAVEKSSARANGRASTHYANVDAEALAKLVDAIIENTEDVGAAFPEEARRIHYHEAPERHIRGTASPREVESLRDEGIDVVAVPVPPHRQSRTH
jgi:hypothetical protein